MFVLGAFHHPNVKCREETDSHSCKSLYIKKKTHQLIPHCFLPVTRRAGVDHVGPGQERTRVTSQALKLCSPFLSKHWPSGSTLPSPSEVLCLLADSFWVFYFNFIFLFIFIFYFYTSVFSFHTFSVARFCGFSCATLEWRVRSKTCDGADSLWGNKPAQGTPQTPQDRWCLCLFLLCLLSYY